MCAWGIWDLGSHHFKLSFVVRKDIQRIIYACVAYAILSTPDCELRKIPLWISSASSFFHFLFRGTWTYHKLGSCTMYDASVGFRHPPHVW